MPSIAWRITHGTAGRDGALVVAAGRRRDLGRLAERHQRLSRQGASTSFAALDGAAAGRCAEGNVGGGTGMICYGFKGGIGTASRKLTAKDGGYTVGVLVQCNYGRAPTAAHRGRARSAARSREDRRASPAERRRARLDHHRRRDRRAAAAAPAEAPGAARGARPRAHRQHRRATAPATSSSPSRPPTRAPQPTSTSSSLQMVPNDRIEPDLRRDRAVDRRSRRQCDGRRAGHDRHRQPPRARAAAREAAAGAQEVQPAARALTAAYEAFLGRAAEDGAGDGNRTHVSSLGSCSSTIELHPPGPSTLIGLRAVRQLSGARCARGQPTPRRKERAHIASGRSPGV